MSTARIRATNCVDCGNKMDAVSDTGNPAESPTPGCPVLCLKCGAIYILADDLTPRKFTNQEADELLKDEETMNELARYTQKIHILRHMQG